MCNCQDTLIPQIGVVTDICTETADVKTFRVEKIGGGKLFEHLPGQCAILSVPGKGEAIFSITSSPTNEKYMEFSIKRCGSITNFLHFDIEPGQQIAVRGPYGNHFPVEDKLKGKDLLFIAGGIGLAPLRSVINYMLDKREAYGSIDVVYGARSKEDFVRYDELTNVWPVQKDTRVHLTIDRAQEGWTGNVGFVPNFLKDLKFTPDKTVLLCGPPIMIKLCLAALIEMGFEKKQVYTTLELRMKCGVGKCGRCNFGNTLSQMLALRRNIFARQATAQQADSAVADLRRTAGCTDIAANAVKGSMCCLLIFAALSVSNILHNIQALRTALSAGIAADAAEDFRIQLTDNIIACLNLFDIKGALVNREGINLANAHAFLNLRLAGKHNLQLRAAL